LMTACVSMVLKPRASPDMLPFIPCNKKRLAVRHMNRSLFQLHYRFRPTTSGSRSGQGLISTSSYIALFLYTITVCSGYNSNAQVKEGKQGLGVFSAVFVGSVLLV
jgi:hypothetical protein